MNIRILDHYGDKEFVNWVEDEFTGLTFTSEIPGGMVSCSFDIPCQYSRPYPWADFFNQIEIFHGPTNVWSGFVFGLSRFWGDSSGIKVTGAGWVAKLGMLTTGTDLVAEQGSTYIDDHLLVAGSELMNWISEGYIAASDYTIPGTLELQPYAYFREAVDRIVEYNKDTHNFYIRNKSLYLIRKTNIASLETSTEFCKGSLDQDLGAGPFANDIRYSYRNVIGAVTQGSDTDTDSAYPLTKFIDSYSDNMTAGQAATAGARSLGQHGKIGSTGGVTCQKIWTLGGGEVHKSEVFPGQVIHVAGVIPAKASPDEVYIANDIDTFEICSMTYNDDAGTVDISPGQLPYTLRARLGRKQK